MPEITPAPAPGGGAPASAGPSTPASTPSTPSATPATPATGTPPAPSSAVPTPASPSAPQPSPAGEPPKERWEDILANARKKTRAEVEAEYRQKYAPYDAFERDPWNAIQGWLSQATTHSLYGPLVRQWMAEQQAGGGQPQDFGPEPEADVPIVDGNGNVTGQTYSAKRLKEWQQWNQQRQQAELDARFQTIEDRESQREAREQQVASARESYSWAQQTLTELRKLPYFTEHEPAIRSALEEHEEWGDNIHAAYNHVLVTQILPNLGQAEQQKVITSLQSKASATTVSPSGVAPAKPAFKTFREAAEYYAAHPDEAQAMASRTER